MDNRSLTEQCAHCAAEICQSLQIGLFNPAEHMQSASFCSVICARLYARTHGEPVTGVLLDVWLSQPCDIDSADLFAAANDLVAGAQEGRWPPIVWRPSSSPPSSPRPTPHDPIHDCHAAIARVAGQIGARTTSLVHAGFGSIAFITLNQHEVTHTHAELRNSLRDLRAAMPWASVRIHVGPPSAFERDVLYAMSRPRCQTCGAPMRMCRNCFKLASESGQTRAAAEAFAGFCLTCGGDPCTARHATGSA